MPQNAYELLAMLMRYVFVLIGGLIVWRSFRWLRRDAKTYKREMKALPDAGLVGEMVNLSTGESQPLPREGVIGSARDADIRVKGDRRSLARFEFEEGKGLKIIPNRRSRILMSGVELNAPGYALHGTQLQFGNTAFRVRLFAGLKVPQPAEYAAPDALLGANVYLESWEAPAENWEMPQGFPMVNDNNEQDFVPYSTGAIPQGAPVDPYNDPSLYEGNYTEDGQMTWQYAYSLQDLQNAMEQTNMNADSLNGEYASEQQEGIPYQSPIPRRRRRRRHEE